LSHGVGRTADARAPGFLLTLWRPSLWAIDILRTEGLVFTVHRRGSYVSPDAK
jgi:hypothetical protein